MPDGLRERKKSATRHALHAATLSLVSELGIDAVTVDDIARRADVSPRTFFNYFSSKEEALIGLDPDVPRRLVDAFSARPPSESPMQAMRVVLREQAAAMAKDTELWPLRLEVIGAHPTLAAQLAKSFGESERRLAEAIAERTGTTVDVDVYPTLLAAIQGVVTRTALHRWLAAGFVPSLPDLVDEAMDVLIDGLPTPPR